MPSLPAYPPLGRIPIKITIFIARNHKPFAYGKINRITNNRRRGGRTAFGAAAGT